MTFCIRSDKIITPKMISEIQICLQKNQFLALPFQQYVKTGTQDPKIAVSSSVSSSVYLSWKGSAENWVFWRQFKNINILSERIQEVTVKEEPLSYILYFCWILFCAQRAGHYMWYILNINRAGGKNFRHYQFQSDVVKVKVKIFKIFLIFKNLMV